MDLTRTGGVPHNYQSTTTHSPRQSHNTPTDQVIAAQPPDFTTGIQFAPYQAHDMRLTDMKCRIMCVVVRGGSEAVERALYAKRAAVENVGVDHRRADVFVAEERLDGSDVGAVFEEVGREAVAERVG